MWTSSSTSSGGNDRRWESLPTMKRAGAPPFISSASSALAGSEASLLPARAMTARSGLSDLALQGSALRAQSQLGRNTNSSRGTSSEKKGSLNSKSMGELKEPSSEPGEQPPKKKLILPHPVRPLQSESKSGSSRRRTYDRSGEEDLGPELVVKKEAIDRECLRCEKKFVAPTKFIRLCNNCGKWATYVHTPHFEGW